MKKIFYLKTCSTCQKILKEVKPGKDVELQDIKSEKMTPEQVDAMAKLAGSYENIFTRKSQKYRSMGLADKKLTEKDYRKLIIEEYTFLKRPVSVIGNEIFIGNSNAAIEALKVKLKK
ncbi:MAG: hypothetical protein NT150_10475 [Bacteroidetes bacterium]|nr:hypothetical protein [Bacteroidota bacterium]